MLARIKTFFEERAARKRAARIKWLKEQVEDISISRTQERTLLYLGSPKAIMTAHYIAPKPDQRRVHPDGRTVYLYRTHDPEYVLNHIYEALSSAAV